MHGQGQTRSRYWGEPKTLNRNCGQLTNAEMAKHSSLSTEGTAPIFYGPCAAAHHTQKTGSGAQMVNRVTRRGELPMLRSSAPGGWTVR
jgi:hypothetical protein